MRREVAHEDPAELTRQKQNTLTFAEPSRSCIDTFETFSRRQWSKQTQLEFLEQDGLDRTIAHKVTCPAIPPSASCSSRRADSCRESSNSLSLAA
jgi:hypothetical protein